MNSENKLVLKENLWRKLFVIIFNLVFIGGFVVYLYINAEKYQQLFYFSALFLFIMGIVTIILVLGNGIISLLVFNQLGANLSISVAFFLAAVSTLANQLPIAGGIISRAYFLKKIYNLSYSKYFSATLALFFYFVSANGIIGFFILIYWSFTSKKYLSSELLIGFLIMAGAFLIFWLPVKQLKKLPFLRERLEHILWGWSIFNAKPLLLFFVIGIQISMMLLQAINYWLAFQMLSQPVTYSQAVLFSAASVLTQLISIAPGGLGVREGIVAAVAYALGLDAGVAVVAVGLERLVSTVVIIVLGLIGVNVLGKKLLVKRT
jgi:uncharacterized membrane protein YbhN (UPF0104 family)